MDRVSASGSNVRVRQDEIVGLFRLLNFDHTYSGTQAGCSALPRSIAIVGHLDLLVLLLVESMYFLYFSRCQIMMINNRLLLLDLGMFGINPVAMRNKVVDRFNRLRTVNHTIVLRDR